MSKGVATDTNSVISEETEIHRRKRRRMCDGGDSIAALYMRTFLASDSTLGRCIVLRAPEQFIDSICEVALNWERIEETLQDWGVLLDSRERLTVSKLGQRSVKSQTKRRFLATTKGIQLLHKLLSAYRHFEDNQKKEEAQA